MAELRIDRVLVTGAGGFIGSHVAEACVDAGWKVRAFVHYNAAGRLGWLENSPHRAAMEFHAGDVRDYDSVSAACAGCDTVIHLAALIGIPYSYVSPLAYIRTNVEGTYNVLQAARTNGIGNLLITSTSETYGTAQYVPMDENHPAVGQSPYAATKIAADQLAISFHRSFGQRVKIVRPFNTYGPRQSARAVIPAVITQLVAGRSKLSLGNLSPTRDLTFVKDTAAAFVALAKHDGLFGRAVNVGSGQEISIANLVAKIASTLGIDPVIESSHERARAASSEVERLLSSSALLRESTGWRPTVNLDEGIQETIAFVCDNLSLYEPARYGV
jgi:NAD dependent epimerase/dehydratase